MERKKEEIKAICQNFDFSSLTEKELNHIAINNDLIKGFNSNKNRYLKLKEEIKPFDDIIFFDVCHLLGIFSVSNEDVSFIISTIKYLYLHYPPYDIMFFINNIKNIKYNEKLANTLINVILTDTLKESIPYFIDICNDFKKFSNTIIKINQNRIKNLRIKSHFSKDDKEDVERIKAIGKSIILEDVIDYIDKERLLNEMPILKPVSRILLLETFDKKELKDIIQFYKYSLTCMDIDEKYLENISIKLNNGSKIEWASLTDPANLILGYILKICSTFSGSGAKIMIDSILNPKIKNVILKNRLGNAFAKATCIYNEEEEYLFCNSIAFTGDILDKMTRKEKNDYYYNYLKIINMQYKSLLAKGFKVKEIRYVENESDVLACLQGREDIADFKELLLVLSYGWVERDEKLFDHQEADYQKQIKKYLI